MQASLGIVSAWRAPHLGHVNSEVRHATTVSVPIYGQFCLVACREHPIPGTLTAQGATQQAPNASARALKPNAPQVTPTTCGFSLIAVSVSAACARRIVSAFLQ